MERTELWADQQHSSPDGVKEERGLCTICYLNLSCLWHVLLWLAGLDLFFGCFYKNLQQLVTL